MESLLDLKMVSGIPFTVDWYAANVVDVSKVRELDAQNVCDECGSTNISQDGYCMNCGLYLPKDKSEETYFQWVGGLEDMEISKQAFRYGKIGLPWVESKNPVLTSMMEYPEAIEFLESRMRTSFQPVDLGDTIAAPARVWRKDTWKRACLDLVEKKCAVPDCYKMMLKRQRSTRTGLCRDHYLEYSKLSRKASKSKWVEKLKRSRDNGDKII